MSHGVSSTHWGGGKAQKENNTINYPPVPNSSSLMAAQTPQYRWVALASVTFTWHDGDPFEYYLKLGVFSGR